MTPAMRMLARLTGYGRDGLAIVLARRLAPARNPGWSLSCSAICFAEKARVALVAPLWTSFGALASGLLARWGIC